MILLFCVTFAYTQEREATQVTSYPTSEKSNPNVLEVTQNATQSVTPLANTYIESNTYIGHLTISNRKPKEGETVYITATTTEPNHDNTGSGDLLYLWFELAFEPELRNYSLESGSDSDTGVKWTNIGFSFKVKSSNP